MQTTFKLYKVNDYFTHDISGLDSPFLYITYRKQIIKERIVLEASDDGLYWFPLTPEFKLANTLGSAYIIRFNTDAQFIRISGMVDNVILMCKNNRNRAVQFDCDNVKDIQVDCSLVEGTPPPACPNYYNVGVAQPSTTIVNRNFIRLNKNGSVYTKTAETDFNKFPCYQFKEEIINGNYMVGIPKCYVKREYRTVNGVEGCDSWFVSDKPRDGYEVHPAFLAMDGETELDYVWIAKYPGILNSENKLCSIPSSSAPTRSISFANYITYCNNNNVNGQTGWHVFNIHEWSLIQLLYLIEYANPNAIGQLGAGCSSGIAATNNACGKTSGFRGIEFLYNNICEFIDYIRCSNLDSNATSTKCWYINCGKGYKLTDLIYKAGVTNSNVMQNAGKGNGWNAKYLFFIDPTYALSTSSPKNVFYANQNFVYFSASDPGCIITSGVYYKASANLFFLNGNNKLSSKSANSGARLAKW